MTVAVTQTASLSDRKAGRWAVAVTTAGARTSSTAARAAAANARLRPRPLPARPLRRRRSANIGMRRCEIRAARANGESWPLHLDDDPVHAIVQPGCREPNRVLPAHLVGSLPPSA